MPIYKGSTNQGLIYYGSPNTNCLTSVPKNVNLEYTYGSWTQPIFSSNTNGILTLSASHESGPAWYAFNGDKTTGDNCWWTAHGVTSTSNPCWIQLKSTIKLKLSQVVIRNEHQTPENFKTAYLQVSNNGSSWTNVATISGTNTGGYETIVNFTVSDGYYYYRLYFTESYSTGGVSIQTLTFSGTAQNTLTLKSGSKVYVPNGKNADGSLKFDEYITSNDIVDNDFGNASREVAFLLTKLENDVISVWPNTIVVSGTSTPDFSGTGYWGVWYDTENNIIKCQAGSNEWIISNGFSLPFCLVSSSSSAVTSLDQVFDWCGFIGSTAFVLPGVKGLIPNGFNADWTYKSVEFTTDTVLTTTRTWDIPASFIQRLFLYNRGKGLGIQNYQTESNSMPTANDWTVWYNPKENVQRWNNSSNTLTDISQWTVDTTMRYIGEIPSDGTSKITSLTTVKVQPLQSGIPITKVYKGSTLVYRFDIDPFSVLFTKSGTFEVPKHCKKLTVKVIAAGGHGGAGGGLVMWGGTGGIGGVVVKIYEGGELNNLPNPIDIVVGVCPNATGAAGQNTSFNGEVIAYGGGGGTNGGFGYSGSNGYNGSGVGGDVTVGAPAADRTFEGVVYGAGGGGTQGGGGGYSGTQGCVFITAE